MNKCQGTEVGSLPLTTTQMKTNYVSKSVSASLSSLEKKLENKEHLTYKDMCILAASNQCNKSNSSPGIPPMWKSQKGLHKKTSPTAQRMDKYFPSMLGEVMDNSILEDPLPLVREDINLIKRRCGRQPGMLLFSESSNPSPQDFSYDITPPLNESGRITVIPPPILQPLVEFGSGDHLALARVTKLESISPGPSSNFVTSGGMVTKTKIPSLSTMSTIPLNAWETILKSGLTNMLSLQKSKERQFLFDQSILLSPLTTPSQIYGETTLPWPQPFLGGLESNTLRSDYINRVECPWCLNSPCTCFGSDPLDWYR